MFMDYNYPVPSVPVLKKVLFVVKDINVAAKLRADLASQHLSTIAPGFGCYEKDFDVIMVCFEINADLDQTWFHTHVLPLKAPNGVVYWP